MPKKYQVTLGTSPDSTLSGIKTPCRRLAREFHPDCHDKTVSPFQAIQEA